MECTPTVFSFAGILLPLPGTPGRGWGRGVVACGVSQRPRARQEHSHSSLWCGRRPHRIECLCPHCAVEHDLTPRATAPLPCPLPGVPGRGRKAVYFFPAADFVAAFFGGGFDEGGS